jgi:uncharacterized membrane protein YjgN (DUF898 family)
MFEDITIPGGVLFSMVMINVVCAALTLRMYAAWRYVRGERQQTRSLGRVLRRLK